MLLKIVKMRKKFIVMLIAVLTVTGSLFAASQISSPAARVYLTENTTISTTQLENEVKVYSAQKGSAVDPLTVLNEMIGTELVKQAIERAGLTITDQETDQLIAQQKASVEEQVGQSLTEEQFEQVIEQNAGMTMEQFRQAMTYQYLTQKFLFQEKSEEIQNTPQPTENEITAFYRKNSSSFTNAECIKVAHIYFSGTDDSVKQKAEDVLSDIKNGTITFEKAVSKYSEDKETSTQGGDIGWFFVNQDEYKTYMGDEYFNGIFDLDAGDISPVLKSNFGYHIVKASAHFDAKLLTLTDAISPTDTTTVHDYIANGLYNSKIQTAMQEQYVNLVSELKDEASVKIFYKQ